MKNPPLGDIGAIGRNDRVSKPVMHPLSTGAASAALAARRVQTLRGVFSAQTAKALSIIAFAKPSCPVRQTGN